MSETQQSTDKRRKFMSARAKMTLAMGAIMASSPVVDSAPVSRGRPPKHHTKDDMKRRAKNKAARKARRTHRKRK